MPEHRSTDRNMQYARVLTIDTRTVDTGDETTSAQLLTLAKKRAIDPTVFDEFTPFFFSGEISSDRWDAYDTRMAESSLRNYAAEAALGVSYLSGHNTRTDALGGTLTGTFTQGVGKKPSTVRSDVYMLKEPGSETFIAKVRAGILRDQSIGFYDGEYMCTICGRDMAQWWTADGCMHMLGMMYTPVDKNGKAKENAEQVKARANIENAHLGEVSNVYDGATPGAMVDKARELNLQGEFSADMRELVQVRYKIELPQRSRVFPVAKIGATTVTEEEIQELRDKVLKAEKERDAAKALVAQAQTVAQRSNLPTTHLELPVHEQLEYLAGERSRLIPLAEDGKQYRTDLITSALEEGVRAMGDTFQQETYKAVLEASPITAIKRMRDDWATIAKATFPAGRQVDPEADAKKTAQATASSDGYSRHRSLAFVG